MSGLRFEDMKRRGEHAGKFYNELKERYREEGVVYEPSVIARRPSIPQKTGKGLVSTVGYYFRYGWYWVWSGIHYCFVETQRP